MQISATYQLILCSLLFSAASAFLIDALLTNSVNFHSHFAATADDKECNIFDEAHFCQQLIIDAKLSLVAISTKCACPQGFKCPNDIEETAETTRCELDAIHRWNKCKLRCTPIDV